MKRMFIALAVIGLIGMSSCAYKTCPTYAKTSPAKVTKEVNG
jgi:hypothetical protein